MPQNSDAGHQARRLETRMKSGFSADADQATTESLGGAEGFATGSSRLHILTSVSIG
jgi:hypothetical protein